jgi:hypothetical protein
MHADYSLRQRRRERRSLHLRLHVWHRIQRFAQLLAPLIGDRVDLVVDQNAGGQSARLVRNASVLDEMNAHAKSLSHLSEISQFR